MNRTARKLAAYLALAAIALQATWPILAQARGLTLVPVCTQGGVVHYIELPAGQTPADGRLSHLGKHCALCFVGADRQDAAPPPALPTWVAIFPGAGIRVPESQGPFRFGADFPLAKPRAPPSPLGLI